MGKQIQIEGQLDFFDFLFNQDNTPLKEMSRFTECDSCWCKTCTHNSRNEAIPRDILGESRPCPCCDSCIDSDEPHICVIGSSKEGCSYRYKEEEGLL